MSKAGDSKARKGTIQQELATYNLGRAFLDLREIATALIDRQIDPGTVRQGLSTFISGNEG